LHDFIPRLRLSLVTERIWNIPPPPLDQGETGHCVGFSMAAWGICSPTYTAYTNKNAHDFYYRCKIVDGEKGNEDGTTIRTAGKVLRAANKTSGYAFAYKPEDVKWWVLNRGSVIAGTVWTERMFTPLRSGEVIPSGAEVGGHAYLIHGWKAGYYYCQNSWGKWGWNNTGRFLLSDKSFAALFRAGGEFMTAIEAETKPKYIMV
jgi:hypothetical protein